MASLDIRVRPLRSHTTLADTGPYRMFSDASLSMHQMREVFLVLCLVSAIPAGMSAQMAGGKVVDASDRRPVKGVTVVIRNVATDAAVQAETDSAGMFTLFPADSGRYVIVFRRAMDILVYPDTLWLTADSVFQKLFVLEFSPMLDMLFNDSVDSPVVPLGMLRARFPEDLAERGLEGSVVVRFVVDTTGRADMATFRVVRSSDEGFSQAVRQSVSSARFRPASSRGRKVRQLVTRTFNFCRPRLLTFTLRGSPPPRRPTLYSEPSCEQSIR